MRPVPDGGASLTGVRLGGKGGRRRGLSPASRFASGVGGEADAGPGRDRVRIRPGAAIRSSGGKVRVQAFACEITSTVMLTSVGPIEVGHSSDPMDFPIAVS